ncbi:MAG: diaminobutyrate acetyltransferase [Gammaproteobacteria bacterium]|nr:diaminobutyrate acetyltransferase [Gammaproteobacteria bacterium]
MESDTCDILTRKPEASDGFAIHQLIAASPPLDLNSTYSYYLLSDHFRDSCVVAESQGQLAGFLSAYLIPSRPDTLFIWQVVVASDQRGRGIAGRMVDDLLARMETHGLQAIEGTVNPSNRASRALFERLARQRGCPLQETTFLEAEAFGPGGGHESEILLRLPLSS